MYEVDVTPQAGSTIDGDMRRIVKVVVTRYEKADGKPIKVGTTEARAWSTWSANRAGERAGRDLIRRDKAKRKRAIRNTIERLTSS